MIAWWWLIVAVLVTAVVVVGVGVYLIARGDRWVEWDH